MSISVHIKPTAGGEKLVLTVDAGVTVGELKDEVHKQNGMAAADQRLIFKGQILKDERTLESYSELLPLPAAPRR